jgi:hypothetical protein
MKQGKDAATFSFLMCRTLKLPSDIQIKVKAFINYPRAAIMLYHLYA